MIYRAPKAKPKFTVTVITAFATDSLIIVASDSRTTNPDGSISDSAKKVETIKLSGRNKILVAQAGHAQLASRAIEILIRKATDIPLTDYRTVADLTAAAIEELKSDIRRQFQGTAEELQRHFATYPFELLLAHFFKGQPYIFTVDFELGVVIKRDAKKIVSIGCGYLLADYCLNALDVKRLSDFEAIAAGIYAVEEVKRVDSRCGGPVQVGMCSGPSADPNGEHIVTHALIVNRQLVAFASAKLQKRFANSSARWKKETRKTISEMEKPWKR